MAQQGSTMGDFAAAAAAMSPAPSATQNQPATGMSPTAKRPLDRSAHVAMQQEGPSKAMTGEELTQGFYNLVQKQETNDKWVMDIARVVHGNADLLNGVIGRMNLEEGRSKLLQQQVDTLTADTRTACDKVDDKHTQRDALLRNELDQMAARLEKGHGELTALIERAAGAPDPSTMAGPPGIELGAIGERLRFLGERVDAQMSQVGRMAETTVERVGALETKSTYMANCVQEIQGKITELGGQVGALTVEVGQLHVNPALGVEVPEVEVSERVGLLVFQARKPMRSQD